MKLLSLFLILIVFTACNETAEEELTQNEPLQDTDTAFTDNQEISADVPQNIRDIFNENYPDAQNVVWEDEGDEYEAEFVMNGENYEIDYDLEGEWLGIGKRIQLGMLPQPVHDKIISVYPDYQVDEIEDVETAAGSRHFEIEIEKGLESIEIIMDEQGNILNRDL